MNDDDDQAGQADDARHWESVVRTWGAAYTFSHDPGEHPDEPYAADRKDGQGTLRAATSTALLDAIKDDAIDRPSGAAEEPATRGDPR